MTRKKIKNWLHLPGCATAAVIHVDKLLEIKSIREVYLTSQAGAYISSRVKADDKVNNALDSRLNREKQWKRKSSTIVKCEHLAEDIDLKTTSLKASKKIVKNKVQDEMKENWSNKLKSLTLQGQFLVILESSQIDVNWKSLLYHLPRNVLQFFINSSIDTLPTNSNLVRWSKRSSPKYNICPNKETLLHTLNNCKTMLDQGRYSWRHDSILKVIFEKWNSVINENDELFCDLPNKYTGISTVPTDLVITSLKPDIVRVNKIEKSVTLLELTVPFDSNIDNAKNRKSQKYENLINDLCENGYEC